MELGYILGSAILYRLRGSDDIPIGSTQIKRVLWALPFGFLFPFGLNEPHIYFSGFILFIWSWFAVTLTEKSDAEFGPQPEARQGTSYVWLTLYGLIVFNPLFGLVHYVTYKLHGKLPTLPYLEGHAEWSEFINGGISAAGALLLWGLVERLI